MISLSDGEVHIWPVAVTELPVNQLTSLIAKLPKDERCSLAAIGDPRRAGLVLQSRLKLRRVLSRYFPDEEIVIRRDHGRKPNVNGAPATPVCFNLSRSGAMAVIAVSKDIPIGIDLERIDSDFPWRPVAQAFFAPDEWNYMRKLPPALAAAAFFKSWVSREAYLKGLGVGLRSSMRQFSVCPRPDAPPFLLRSQGAHTAGFWELHAVAVPRNYRAVLASKGHAKLHYMH